MVIEYIKKIMEQMNINCSIEEVGKEIHRIRYEIAVYGASVSPKTDAVLIANKYIEQFGDA
jgi:hypothetical protein